MSWYNPLSWYIDKENLDAGNAAAEKLKQMNEEDYGPGGRIYKKIQAQDGTQAAEDTYATVLNQGQDQTIPYTEAVDSVNDAFLEGWNEAYDQRTGQAKSILNAPMKILTDIAPWWFWVVAAVALFIYMGGGVWVRKQLAKA